MGLERTPLKLNGDDKTIEEIDSNYVENNKNDLVAGKFDTIVVEQRFPKWVPRYLARGSSHFHKN